MSRPTRIYPISNALHNPRPSGLSGWAVIGNLGGAVTITETTDPELGACAEVTITPDVGVADHVITTLRNGSDRLPTRDHRLVYMRVRVKAVSAPPEARCLLTCGFFNVAGTSVGSQTLADRSFADLVDGAIEGWAVAPQFAREVATNVFCGGAEDPMTFRIASAQVALNPWGDVPAYCDGDQPGCSWDGAANASTSSGTVTREVPSYGFNDAQLQEVPPDVAIADDIVLHKTLGADVIRLPVSFHTTAGKSAPTLPQTTEGGPIDWSVTEIGVIMSEIRTAGLKAIPLFWQAAPWMNGDTGDVSWAALDPLLYDDLATLYAQFATDYGDVCAAFEIHNEPNLAFFWGYTQDPPTYPDAIPYTNILKELYPALKAAAPSVPVLGGALSHLLNNTAEGRGLEAFLHVMYENGAIDAMDAVSVHPYPAGATSGPTSPVGNWGAGLWGVLDRAQGIKELFGDGAKPLWATEFGMEAFGKVGDYQQAQANALARGALARAGIEGRFIHTLTADPLQLFSAINYPSLRPRPQAQTLAA